MEITAPSILPVNTGKSETSKDLRKACADFEAHMTSQLLSAMRKTIPTDGLFKKSNGEEMFQSMLDQELAIQISQGRGTGFGETLYKQLMQQHPNKGDL
jgi:flagellar protein FlgJ